MPSKVSRKQTEEKRGPGDRNTKRKNGQYLYKYHRHCGLGEHVHHPHRVFVFCAWRYDTQNIRGAQTEDRDRDDPAGNKTNKRRHYLQPLHWRRNNGNSTLRTTSLCTSSLRASLHIYVLLTCVLFRPHLASAGEERCASGGLRYNTRHRLFASFRWSCTYARPSRMHLYVLTYVLPNRCAIAKMVLVLVWSKKKEGMNDASYGKKKMRTASANGNRKPWKALLYGIEHYRGFRYI